MFVMFFMFLDKSCTEERAQCPRRRQVARLFPPVSSVHHIATDAWQLILPFHSIPFMSFQSIFCEFLPGFFRLQKKTCHFHALTSLLVSLLTAKEVMHRGALFSGVARLATTGLFHVLPPDSHSDIDIMDL
jgi:hypothetical protein